MKEVTRNRVLHICPYMHPHAGGPPIVVDRLCRLSPSLGWDASVITTSLYCDDDVEAFQNSLKQRFEATVLPIRGPHALKRADQATAAIDRAVGMADVVHLHTLWHPLNAIARKACRRHGRKYALMPHGMLDPYSLSQKRWRKAIYLAITERSNLRDASRLVFTTAHEQQAAQQRLPWLAAGEVIPLGADCPPEALREASAATFTNLFPTVLERQCILFLGRIDPKKGLDRLFRILPELTRKHPKCLLVVVGHGEPTYVQHIKQLVHLGNLENHVLFTGALGGEAKWGAFASSEVFVLPSRQENFAISVAEAMHMALPVIISEQVNSWPYVQAANAGFVVGEDQIEVGLSQRLDELLRSSEKARCLGRCGQDFAKEHFTWQRVAQDMTRLYRGMLSE